MTVHNDRARESLEVTFCNFEFVLSRGYARKSKCAFVVGLRTQYLVASFALYLNIYFLQRIVATAYSADDRAN